MMTGDANKTLVRDWLSVFNTGDFSTLDAIHADDCRNHAPGPFDLAPWPTEGRVFGPAEFRATVEWIRSNQPDIHVEIEDMVAEGSQVVAWVRATGTPTGAGGPIPPTGAPVDFGQAHRFRIGDGKVVEHWAVRDDLRSLIQAGVVAPPAGRPQ